MFLIRGWHYDPYVITDLENDRACALSGPQNAVASEKARKLSISAVPFQIHGPKKLIGCQLWKNVHCPANQVHVMAGRWRMKLNINKKQHQCAVDCNVISMLHDLAGELLCLKIRWYNSNIKVTYHAPWNPTECLFNLLLQKYWIVHVEAQRLGRMRRREKAGALPIMIRRPGAV